MHEVCVFDQRVEPPVNHPAWRSTPRYFCKRTRQRIRTQGARASSGEIQRPGATADRKPGAVKSFEPGALWAIKPGGAAPGGVADYSAAAGTIGRWKRRRAPQTHKRLAISSEATTTSTSRGRPASMIMP